MRDRIGAWWMVATVVVATWGLSESRAHAQYTAGDYGGVAVAGGVVGGILGAGQLAFAIGDVVSWADDTPFAEGWAVFELVYSGLVALTDLLFVIGLGSGAGPDDVGAIVGVGLVPLVLGGVNIAHAIWSLGNLRRDPPPVAMSIVPTQGGLLATAGGTF